MSSTTTVVVHLAQRNRDFSRAFASGQVHEVLDRLRLGSSVPRRGHERKRKNGADVLTAAYNNTTTTAFSTTVYVISIAFQRAFLLFFATADAIATPAAGLDFLLRSHHPRAQGKSAALRSLGHTKRGAAENETTWGVGGVLI